MYTHFVKFKECNLNSNFEKSEVILFYLLLYIVSIIFIICNIYMDYSLKIK